MTTGASHFACCFSTQYDRKDDDIK